MAWYAQNSRALLCCLPTMMDRINLVVWYTRGGTGVTTLDFMIYSSTSTLMKLKHVKVHVQWLYMRANDCIKGVVFSYFICRMPSLGLFVYLVGDFFHHALPFFFHFTPWSFYFILKELLHMHKPLPFSFLVRVWRWRLAISLSCFDRNPSKEAITSKTRKIKRVHVVHVARTHSLFNQNFE